MVKIPKIFHLTRGQGKLPPAYKECLRQLRELHPEWEFRVYDDADSRQIVLRHMPEMLEVYDAYAFNIQRADLFRVLAIYLYGGFYLDMDVFCLKPLDSLLEFHLILGEEKTLSVEECQQLSHRFALRVANYMFGSIPGHRFWLVLLEAMAIRSKEPVYSENDILNTTGPGLFSDIYHELGKSFTDIVLLKNADRICPSKWCGKVSCHFGDFGLHKHIGSWRWEHKRKAAEPVRIGNGDAGIQGAVKALAARSGARKGIGDTQIRILETYDQGQSSYDGLTHVYNRLKDIGQPASDTSSSRGSKVLVCGIPFLYEKKLSRRNTNIIYTTFESDRLPPFWVASINRHYHYCVVPHEAVKKVFVDSGITIPISVIHQGYTRYPRRHRQQAIGKDFTVGFLGIPVNRKNVLKLYGACKRLKQKEIPGIRLAVHFAAFYEWLDKEPFEAMKADPMIKWTEGRFDSRQISDWYDKLSCYVYPSAGEGWSFTPRESLYMGLPTIISDIPVHKELVDSNYYGVIHSTEKEAADFSGHFFGNWARIDESDIAVIIKDVYRNYSHYARQAARGARWIEDKWFNEEVRHKMLGFIESL